MKVAKAKGRAALKIDLTANGCSVVPQPRNCTARHRNSASTVPSRPTGAARSRPPKRAAAAAAKAEHERNQLRGRAHRRRAALDAQITELHRKEAEAHKAAAAAAEVASTLDRVPKDPAERQRIAERIRGADVLHPRQREAALTKDIESAERITLRVAAGPDRSAVDRLEAELRARTELSPHRQRQETLERDAQLAAPAHSHEIGRSPGVEYQIATQPVPVEPPLPSPSIQPGI